jgi:hypothetical protein
MDPVEEMYHKTLSSLRFMIKYDELHFDEMKSIVRQNYLKDPSSP